METMETKFWDYCNLDRQVAKLWLITTPFEDSAIAH